MSRLNQIYFSLLEREGDMMATTIVARYDPPGNYVGQYSAQVGNKISSGIEKLCSILVLNLSNL